MDVTENDVRLRVREIYDYQLTHGMLLIEFKQPEPTASTIRDRIRHHIQRAQNSPKLQDFDVQWAPTTLAVTILPTQFPRRLFQQAQALQPVFNELYVRVADDHDWLYEVLSPLLPHDSFLASLWGIFQRVRATRPKREAVCGIFRSDYMIDRDALELRQVEMNVFSASGFAHAQNVAGMHRHLQRSVGPQTELPNNENIVRIANMLAEANKIYSQSSPPTANGSQTASQDDHATSQNDQASTCILMIVQPANFNVADERPIEYALWESNVPCYRCEWKDVLSRTELRADGKLLFRFNDSQADCEVSVVYYRAGYEAREYGSSGCETRLRLEVSNAIKCPDIATHLTTSKTVQQALTQPGALERFLSPQHQHIVRSTFMEMYALDNSPTGLQARTIAIMADQATNYVLKSNGDGGGHNIYREDIPSLLAKVPVKEWCKYTLMKMIETPCTTGMLLSPNGIYHGEVTSELGILGTCIWRKHEGEVTVLRNESSGWTLKTKPADVDGMMVVKGVGAMDCPALS